MKPVVSASYAQSGVDAGGRQFFACGGRASPNGMGNTDPAAAETGYCAGAYSLCGKRPLYGTGLNLHCGATRLSRRERCVQRSLPCVSSSGKGKLCVRAPWPWGAGRYSLERLLAKEDKNRRSLLWKSPRLLETDGYGIAVRLEWQSGSGSGNEPPDTRRGNHLRGDGRLYLWKTNPT